MELSDVQYRRLAEFRRQLREFLEFSADAAHAQGLQPQQHQLMLAVRGAPSGAEPSVGHLSGVLALAPHSVSELVDRLVALGMVQRVRSDRDRRVQRVELTARGHGVLDRLSTAHLAELQVYGPRLASSLAALTSEGETRAQPDAGRSTGEPREQRGGARRRRAG